MERMPSPQRWDEVLMELYELAGSPGVRVVEDYARRDPDAGSLSKSTVGELLKGKANPRRASVEAFVLGCLYYARTRRPPVALPEGQDVSGYWMDRYDQAAGADTRRSRSAAMREFVTEGPGWRLKQVAACTPADVGVHPTERREGMPEEVRWWEDLPDYLPRDHDEGLRRRLKAASAGGGFVVVVGDSATGKTRSLYEAVRTVLQGWHVLLPHDPAAISDAYGHLPPRTVVWLDDTPTERFLIEDTQHGLTKTQLLQLVERASGGPIVVVDVLWHTRYEALTASPTTGYAAMSADQYRNTRDVLTLAGEPVVIDSRLSRAEEARAIRIAANTSDRRWREALDDPEFGAVQHLAGAPELLHRWRHADPYTGAVITAALDARRMGVQTSLPSGLLMHAADGYLDGRTRTSAPVDWFKTALSTATQPRKGTTAPLIPTSDPMGRTGTVAGYSVADYLLQQGLRERSYNATTVSLWDALTNYVTDVGDLSRLLRSARERMLYHWAELLYRKAVRFGLTTPNRVAG